MRPSLLSRAREPGLVAVIARAGRADGADVARDGGSGMNSRLSLRGADVVRSVIVT